MKRILVYGMTNNKGGIETYVMSVFRAMDKTQLMFDFVTDFETMAYADEVQAAGAKIYYIPAKRKHPIGQLCAFSRLLKTHPEYDTVYFNILNAGSFYNMLPVIRRKRRIAAHAHNNSADNMRLHRIFRPWLIRCASVKLACSQAAARFMFGDRAFERGEVTIIRNAIDVSAYRYDQSVRERKRAELGLEDRFIVCHVARMDRQKNPLFVLDVFEQIRRLDSSAALLYVGAGPMEDEVKAYAAGKGLEGVVFLGMRDDVPELLQTADVFLLPSLYEGLGIALVEAQAAGLRCFASAEMIPHEVDVTGLTEFVSLKQPPGYWAERIRAARGYERKDTTSRIKEAGYDIETQIRIFETMMVSANRK